ncbi:DUF364 domain-containing protein [Methanoculleus sp. 10]|jgi:uncharacterized protein (DUF4213/DUF364 family)|uniref:DUF364 domain-containing protein n=1 Tax=Methanoculleus sp. 10 TaxID=430615 RepID=UPI001B6F7F92|nr:DUF364 domain-containing protein [Methanoculleus sp. 10]MBP7410993.1 DUF364 domain-containing protein [Methanoculleus sp.]
MGDETILGETIRILEERLGERMDDVTVERVVVGVFFAGVKLSTGHGGICATPIKSIPEAVCCPSSAQAMPHSGRLRERSIRAYVADALGDRLMRKALGIAVVSALSALANDVCPQPGYTVTRGVDAVDLLPLSESGNVVIVGALTPYLRALKQVGQPFRVIEMDPRTLKPDELPFFVPVEETDRVVPWADTLIITGTTLINGTIEHLLELARPEATVVVLGPTVSILPDALFSRGVDISGGDMVTDPDRLLDILAEGGSGYHFYGKGADRIAVRRSS